MVKYRRLVRILGLCTTAVLFAISTVIELQQWSRFEYMRSIISENCDKVSISRGINNTYCFSEMNPNRLLIKPSHSGAGHTMAVVNCHVKVAAHFCLRPLLSSTASMSHGLGRGLLEEFFGRWEFERMEWMLINRVELYFTEEQYGDNLWHINTVSRPAGTIIPGTLFTMRACTADTDYERTAEWFLSELERNSRSLYAYKRENIKREQLVVAVHVRRGDIVKKQKYRSRLITDKVFIDLTTKVVQLTPPEISIRVVFLTDGGEHGYVNENGAETDLCDEIL